jgi:hypothetical protein
MNAPVTPVPTLEDLIQRAIDDDAVGKIALSPYMSPPQAMQIAAEAVQDAFDAWQFENGITTDLPPQLLVVAMLGVLDRGWDARDEEWDRRRKEAVGE